MIVSETKLEDMKFRRDLLELTRVSLKFRLYDLAKWFGSLSHEVADRIKNFDYSALDTERRSVDKPMKNAYAHK